MATDETGWTDKYPHKDDAGDEYYFVRRKDRGDVVVMGFSMGKAWLNGVSYEPSELRSHLFLGPLSPADTEQLNELRSHLFLGPLSPADTEQLNELRRACEAARKWFRWYKSSRAYPSDAPVSSLTVLQMLEAVLNPKPEKET